MIIAIVIFAFIASLILFRHMDVKSYNNGVCKECGSPLTRFDTDSQGGRGYVCYSCEPFRYIWISYPWVDHKHVNPILPPVAHR